MKARHKTMEWAHQTIQSSTPCKFFQHQTSYGTTPTSSTKPMQHEQHLAHLRVMIGLGPQPPPREHWHEIVNKYLAQTIPVSRDFCCTLNWLVIVCVLVNGSTKMFMCNFAWPFICHPWLLMCWWVATQRCPCEVASLFWLHVHVNVPLCGQCIVINHCLYICACEWQHQDVTVFLCMCFLQMSLWGGHTDCSCWLVQVSLCPCPFTPTLHHQFLRVN